MKSKIENCLPAKSREEILWKLYWGNYNPLRISKEHFFEFAEFYHKNIVEVNQIIFTEVNHGNWNWGPNFKNIRKV